jgi:hypothetical protein
MEIGATTGPIRDILVPRSPATGLKTAGLRDVLAAALQDLPHRRGAGIRSLANGTSGAASDIDLLVIGDTGLRALAPDCGPWPNSSAGDQPGHMTAANLPRTEFEPASCGPAGEGEALVKGSADELERLA